ncbi:hypothetical protein AVEN_11672-1 [Araneus ventricosus]|uniref:Endonuclease/exonuclease/phosphatase domain-containing protein n=1 Tax=Araneus ventricosus TaxID=182803 RepID=A0A4Y2K706_ARAVE|nr:hypothetical protein AVEN_11672-1 [Araneus ventricosus]
MINGPSLKLITSVLWTISQISGSYGVVAVPPPFISCSLFSGTSEGSKKWTGYCSTSGYSGSSDLPPTVRSGGLSIENMDWTKFPLTVINLYSPGGKFGAIWLDSLYSQISSPFVLLGDFNIHHPALRSYYSSSDANLVLDWISTKFMCLLNMNRFTRYQGTQAPSLLDLSICSADLVNMIRIEISHYLYDGDHCPIFISLCNFGTKSLQTRKYINWGQFSKKVNTHLHSQGEVSSLNKFTQIFQESANSSSYSFTRSAHTHFPW